MKYKKLVSVVVLVCVTLTLATSFIFLFSHSCYCSNVDCNLCYCIEINNLLKALSLSNASVFSLIKLVSFALFSAKHIYYNRNCTLVQLRVKLSS